MDANLFYFYFMCLFVYYWFNWIRYNIYKTRYTIYNIYTSNGVFFCLLTVIYGQVVSTCGFVNNFESYYGDIAANELFYSGVNYYRRVIKN